MFKTLSDRAESDSSMKIRLYPRLISLVLFWTASFRRYLRWRHNDWNCKHGWEHTKMHWNLQDKVDLKRVLKEHDQSSQWIVKWSADLEFVFWVVIVKPLLKQMRQWPVVFFISHLGIPLLFSLLTTAFLAVWFVKFFSGHRSFGGAYSFMLFKIVFSSFPVAKILGVTSHHALYK